MHSAAGCSQPVRLTGRVRSTTVDTRTGQIISEAASSTGDMPDGVVYKACGNRRAAVCASCAEIYRADAYQLVAAGMKGGKGIPASVGGHPAVFATTTAPGFGLVHTTRTNKKNQPAPCRARKTPGPVPTRCRPALHAPTPRRRQPARPTAVPPLLRLRPPRRLERLRLRTVATHHHRREPIVRPLRPRPRPHRPGADLLRQMRRVPKARAGALPHPGPLRRHRPRRQRQVIGPPAWANQFLLIWVLRQAVETTRFLTHPLVLDDARSRLVDQPTGWLLEWGTQLDIRPVRVRADDPLSEERVTAELDHAGRKRLLSGTAVAGYLAKYATKATEAAGHVSRRLTPATVGYYATDTHPGRIIDACWRLGARGLQGFTDYEASPYRRMRRWAHMLGYGGHFFTKSRRYSATFRQLRQARVDYRRAHHLRHEHQLVHEHQVLEVIGELVYAGTGWHTTGDALLANTSAAFARERRRIGKEEIATTG